MVWSVCVNAQQQNIWYFGKGAGLDFNSGSPVPIYNGRTGDGLGTSHDVEGTAGICDAQGAILFYCDGSRVYNKLHAVMKNGSGILSDPSSSQSSLILPQPGSGRFYYLFTTDDFFFNKLKSGFRYSVIDMCAENGLGAVIFAQKNVLLLDTATEKLTAVKHANGIDYWVIVHKYLNNAFYAYKLTAGGVSPPIISNAGSPHQVQVGSSFGGTAIGQMKASPDGTRLALAVGNSTNCLKELFNFDKSTGVVSGFINLNVNGLHMGYGISFSPDNSKLYVSHVLNSNVIAQYDLLAGGGHPDSIRNSRYDIIPPIRRSPGGIQLGPDGKIYVAHRRTELSVINNPNAKGAACNYAQDAISLNGKSADIGMANMVDGFNYPNVANHSDVSLGPDTMLLCSQKPILLQTQNNYGSYLWSTGATTPAILITSPGQYWLKVDSSFCQSADTINIGVLPPAKVNLGNDTMLCSITSHLLKAQHIHGSYLWSTGATTPAISIASPGQYWLKVDSGYCKSADTINVGLLPQVKVDLGNDTIVCPNASLQLLAKSVGATAYTWSTNEKTPAIRVNTSGWHWVDASNGYCQARDSIRINFWPLSVGLSLGPDTSYCFSNPLTLQPFTFIVPDSLLWNTSAKTSAIQVYGPGMYWVEAAKWGCTYRDSLLLSQKPIPIISLGTDRMICKTDSIMLDAGNSGATYLWNNQTFSQTQTVQAPGFFRVTVTNAQGCSDSASITLDTFPSPFVFLGTDTFVCEGDAIVFDAGINRKTYLWQDGSAGRTMETLKAGSFHVVITDANNCRAEDEVILSMKKIPKPDLGLNIAVCNPDLILKPTAEFIAYTWQDGSSSSFYRVTDYGAYTLKVIDSNHCVGSTQVEVTDNCSYGLFIPTAFTPNGDTNNDYFFPVIRNIKRISWQVYNRWGEMVFQTNELNKSWDGMYKGQPAPSEVYIYQVTYTALSDKVFSLKGNVTLLR